MTPDAAYQEALRRIDHARASAAEVLDLGDLPLDRLPPELGDLATLRILSLGLSTPKVEQGRVAWEFVAKRPVQQFRDLAPLAQLTGLQHLALSGCRQLTDFGPLAQLTGLQHLDLSYTSVADVRPLAGFANLKKLYLQECTGAAPFVTLRPLLDQLEELYLFKSEWQDLPPAVCGQSERENVLHAMRAHYADLDRGQAGDAELKVFVLGNGRVGKTQLCRRLKGQPYDPDIPTTHGIQLGHVERTIGGRVVRLNLWDFGGQDIYHGAHALFLQGQAVFLLLWTPRHEEGSFDENGVTIRNRPLPYWLDYLRGLAGTESPVLVLQSQCDTANDRQPSPKLATDDFRFLRYGEISPSTD